MVSQSHSCSEVDCVGNPGEAQVAIIIGGLIILSPYLATETFI